MIWTAQNIKEMQDIDIMKVDKEELTDLNDIVIDTRKPVPQKLREFASQTKNLFAYRVDDYVVKVSYAETELTVNDKLKNYITRLAEINY